MATCHPPRSHRAIIQRARDGGGAFVVDLALRSALNARPSGSQGCATGKANDKSKKTRTKEQQKPQLKNKNQNQKKGHF
jgi:hypothetical protein